jgi:acetyl-CoA synthetase
LSEEKSMVGDVYYPAPQVIASAHIPDVNQVNDAAMTNLSGFWRKLATEDFEWYQPWATVIDDSNAPFYSWFSGAKVNIVHNALDRHMRTAVRNKAAIIFEGEPGDCRVYTYRQLNHEVSKFAGVLRSMGVAKGDPVAIFMGRIPEQLIAMLACAKIGAVHAVVHANASADALAQRIVDSGAKMLITCDGAWSRGNIVELKRVADEALEQDGPTQSLICVRRTAQEVDILPGRDYWYHDLMALSIADPKTLTEFMDAEDPLFMLYSTEPSGPTKAVVHTHGGYMVGIGTTLKWVFDIKPADVWWCTADPSSILGHSYVVYSPLILGATSFIYEGVPTYPYPDRWWQIVAEYSVTILYTTPLVIRDLMRFGDSWPKRHDLSSLRLLGTTGEPINPEAWKWFYRVIGREKCPIMDTWLQRETGSFVISPLPSMPLKPGSAALPLPGIQVDVVDERGESLYPNIEGSLVIKNPWPAMLRAVHGDTDFYVEKYWEQFKELGYYQPGDRAMKDEDGYIWICGPA